MPETLLPKNMQLPLLLALLGCVSCSRTGVVPAQQIDTPSRAGAAAADSVPSQSATLEPSPDPSPTPAPSPSATELVFGVGQELTIQYLRELEIQGSQITFHERLAPGYNYARHLVSYISEGSRIFGLLTVPFGDVPAGGFKAIVFNHGYIPPSTYRTLERYGAYVDYLARSGFVVFKIDLRGHGDSEGFASGSYFSPGYTIDAISALKSLQTLDYVDPEGIGMWGHSMAGNLVLRAMLIEPEIQAGVIWAGAVYSYQDFARYGIDDNSYRPPATPADPGQPQPLRSSQLLFEAYGRPDEGHIFWDAVSLTEHIQYLDAPLQLHHAENDPVVNIGYSYGLAEALQAGGKYYEFYTYEGGGHNLVSPYFDQAMLRTVEFFQDNL